MEIREAQRTRVKPVDVRRFDTGIAQACKVAVPNIVKQNEQYVGWWPLRLLLGVEISAGQCTRRPNSKIDKAAAGNQTFTLGRSGRICH